MTVKLFSADNVFVTALDLPPFNEPPQVLIWGVRVFMRVGAVGAWSYIEVFAYCVP